MDSRLVSVVEEADANRAQFEGFCRSLTQEELEAPIPDTTWHVRDYISHLASIDIYVADWFEHTAAGTRFRVTNDDGTPFNIDSWNESRIEERRAASVDDLFLEAAGHRERLWAAVDRFNPETLDRTFNFRGTDITFLRYLQLWTAHDPAHTADMLRGLPGSKRDSNIEGWLDRYRM